MAAESDSGPEGDVLMTSARKGCFSRRAALGRSDGVLHVRQKVRFMQSSRFHPSSAKHLVGDLTPFEASPFRRSDATPCASRSHQRTLTDYHRQSTAIRCSQSFFMLFFSEADCDLLAFLEFAMIVASVGRH